MPTRKRKSGENGPAYEAAFAELQKIVARLEEGSTSLEESLALFERGQQLAKLCSELLEKAELRIRELSVRAAAEPDEVEE
jgi:exodeoxyribonuclease VII small subunit